MKKINIIYWILTGLYSLFIIASSIPGVMSAPDSVKIMVTQLGYPAYFIPFLSVAKILGGIALLVPGFPRIREWAYAGLFFDLISAIYSFIAINIPASGWFPIIIFLLVLAGSYYFYHKRLKMAAAPAFK